MIAVAGCAKNESHVAGNRRIILGVDGPSNRSAVTRAPLDEWENTPVTVAYMFAATQTVFDKTMTVIVGDVGGTDVENDGEHIDTGMEYPADDSQVSFRGYYPVAVPDEAGVVAYDISKGDVDVMLSNTASGSLTAQISDKLIFRHQLTRVTFRMRCAQNQSYPESVFGMRAGAATSKLLMTTVSLDPGDTVEPATFKMPGSIFCGDLDGFVIPLYGEPPVTIDMMLQPDTPLAFRVASLTADRDINITNDPPGKGIWSKLTTVGGEKGTHYIVDLAFTGEIILAQNISAAGWFPGNQDLGGGSKTWW